MNHIEQSGKRIEENPIGHEGIYHHSILLNKMKNFIRNFMFYPFILVAGVTINQ